MEADLRGLDGGGDVPLTPARIVGAQARPLGLGYGQETGGALNRRICVGMPRRRTNDVVNCFTRFWTGKRTGPTNNKITTQHYTESQLETFPKTKPGILDLKPSLPQGF